MSEKDNNCITREMRKALEVGLYDGFFNDLMKTANCERSCNNPDTNSV